MSTGAEALEKLMAGNRRAVAAMDLRPNQTSARRLEVAQGQKPFAAILGCSDSRVPLEIIFDQGFGDLFVVRVAGNIANRPVVIGSIEFAVQHLDVPLVMVLGHEQCGAVEATIEAVVHKAEVHGQMHVLVDAIQPAVYRVQGRPGDLLDNAARANVEIETERLRSAEPILATMVRLGKLKIVGGWYNLVTGEVEIIVP